MMSKRVERVLVEDEAFIARHKASFDELIESIILSEVKSGANLERIKGVLSLRLGKKARLLAKKKWVEGQLIWVLLELLPNHKYHKAHYLKPGATEKFFKENNDRIMALALSKEHTEKILSINNTDVEAAMAGVGVDPDVFIAPEEVVIYKRQVIHLTDKQDECLARILDGLTHEQFIALVAGAPGSGKTLLAKGIIDALHEVNDGTTRIFYIAESQKLRDEMTKQSGVSPVECCGYLHMLRHAGVDDLDNLMAVDEIHMVQYFSRVQDAAKTRAAMEGEEAVLDAQLSNLSFKQFRQECMVMSGIEDIGKKGFEEYASLGRNHSIFHGNSALQHRLWNIYQQYMSDLEAEKQYDPQLTRFVVNKIEGNPVFVVDEALDLTRVQLQALLSMGARVVLLGDHHQNLQLTSHSIEYINSLITKAASSVSETVHTYVAKLEQSYRCSTKIAGILSKLLKVKRNVTAHGSDLVDTQVMSALGADGMVALSSCTPKQIEHASELCKRASTAVICPRGIKEAVSAQLDTALVFTVDEIKGLGYHRIICWDVITKETAERLMALFEGPKKYRDEITAEDTAFISDLNAIFTAISRAEMEVVFMSSNDHPVITNCIHKLIEGVGFSPLEMLGSEVEVSTEDDWREEALRQQEAGNLELALDIAKRFGFRLTLASDAPSIGEALPAGESVRGSGESKQPDNVGPADMDEERRRELASTVIANKSDFRGVKKTKKSKKKKKQVKRVAEVKLKNPEPEAPSAADEVKSPDEATVPIALADMGLGVRFKCEANPGIKSKGRKGKKSKKAWVERVIDFSCTISAENLRFMMMVPQKQLHKLSQKHIEALLTARIDEAVVKTPDGCHLYAKVMDRIFSCNERLHYYVNKAWLAGAGDHLLSGLVSGRDAIKDTVIAHLMSNEASMNFLLVYLPALTMQFARIDKKLLIILTLSMRVDSPDGMFIRGFANHAPHGYQLLLKLCMSDYYIGCAEPEANASLMKRFIAVTLREVGEPYFGGNESKQKIAQSSLLKLLFISMECQDVVFDLFKVAVLSPEIRASLIAELKSIFLLSTTEGRSVELIQLVVEKYPECFALLVSMAELDKTVRQFLVKYLTSEQAGNGTPSRLLAVAERCDKGFDDLCTLAEVHDDVAKMFLEVFVNSDVNIDVVISESQEFQEKIASSLKRIYLASPVLKEGMSKAFVELTYKYTLEGGRTGKARLLDFIVLYDSSAIYYRLIWNFACIVPEVAEAYIKAVELPSSVGGIGDHLHAVAAFDPLLFINIIAWAKEDDGKLEKIISLIQKGSEEKPSPLVTFSTNVTDGTMKEVNKLLETEGVEEIRAQAERAMMVMSDSARDKVEYNGISAANPVRLFNAAGDMEAADADEAEAKSAPYLANKC